MAALATQAQLEARLGRPLTAGAETTRALALIDDASAAVRAYIGQKIGTGTSTVRVRARGLRFRLAQRPVVAVTVVADVDGNPLEFTWDAGENVTLFDLPLRGWVDVTYDHGYAAVPDAIVAVVCQIVGRALGTKPENAGITQEAITNYSYSQGAAAAAGPMGMLADEKAVLKKFRRAGGMVVLA